MSLLLSTTVLVCAATLNALANPAVPVESSRELNGSPVAVNQAAPKRVQLEASCQGRLTMGEPVFSEPDGHDTVRLPLSNTASAPLKIRVSTSFIRTDGDIVPNPYSDAKGGFEGMTRGFLGVLSMGASEMAMVNDGSEATIVTSHLIAPSQQLIVEHQLPFICDQVVGSRSRVCVITESVDSEHAKEVRRVMKEQYWKVRDLYFQERMVETKRWEDLRNRLDQERASMEPVSEAYHKAMDAYWKAHQSHQATLAELESKFLSFARTQEQSLRNALTPKQP